MRHKSHGSGEFSQSDFAQLGADCVFEQGVMVFHPETIHLGSNVYVGHQSILKGYYRNSMHIGDETWIGQQCFFHSAGGLTIGPRVGIGPTVKIITSAHADEGRDKALLNSRVDFAPVVIEEDSNIGVGCVILPGVTVGRGARVAAGAVVTRSLPAYCVAAGVPARVVKERP